MAARGSLSSKFFAEGTSKVKASKLGLAEDLAVIAGHHEVYPLSEETLEDVAAALLVAGYSSGYSYVSELRLRHQELDHPIGPALLRKFGMVKDALDRGQGPPAKAPEIRPDQIPVALHDDESNIIFGPTRSFITASAWLLREAELADLDFSSRNVVFVSDSVVSLKLPMTKADQRGVGAERTLQCHCHLASFDEAPPSRSCGPCALRVQVAKIEEQFGISFDSPAAQGFPLFPTVEGLRPLKTQVVAAWSTALGTPAKGHSGRRSGAKSRARTAWSLWMIQFFGRWASASVLEYVEEALAQRTHMWSVSSASSASASQALPALPPSAPGIENLLGASQLPGEIASLSDRTSSVECALASLQDAVDARVLEHSEAVRVATDESCVVSNSRIHFIPQGGLELPRPMWAALCGWRFGISNVGSLSILPLEKTAHLSIERCDRCMRRRAFGK